MRYIQQAIAKVLFNKDAEHEAKVSRTSEDYLNTATEIIALWIPDGMTTPQAVAYIKHGADAKELIADLLPLLEEQILPQTNNRAKHILANLEADK